MVVEMVVAGVVEVLKDIAQTAACAGQCKANELCTCVGGNSLNGLVETGFLGGLRGAIMNLRALYIVSSPRRAMTRGGGGDRACRRASWRETSGHPKGSL